MTPLWPGMGEVKRRMEEDEFCDRMERGGTIFAWVKVKKELEMFLVDLFVNGKDNKAAKDLIREFVANIEANYPEVIPDWEIK